MCLRGIIDLIEEGDVLMDPRPQDGHWNPADSIVTRSFPAYALVYLLLN